jgi:hypothetical protein
MSVPSIRATIGVVLVSATMAACGTSDRAGLTPSAPTSPKLRPLRPVSFDTVLRADRGQIKVLYFSGANERAYRALAQRSGSTVRITLQMNTPRLTELSRQPRCVQITVGTAGRVVDQTRGRVVGDREPSLVRLLAPRVRRQLLGPECRRIPVNSEP